MRTIRRTSAFKRDFKREMKGRHKATLEAELLATVALLAADSPLAERLRDHALTGDWKDFRDLGHPWATKRIPLGASRQ